MKKLVKFAGSVLVALSALFVVSCNGSGDDYSSESDTVLTLSTPSVSVKAYPGVNYVYWNSVPNANKYYVTKLANDIVVSTETTSPATLYKVDTDISNNVKYTYKVQAIGNVSSRAVYTSDSSEGSASATAIVPPVATSALNMAAYEGGYDGSTAKTLSDSESKKYLLTADNIAVAQKKDSIGISFVSKAYLNYTLYADNGNYAAVTNTNAAKSLPSTFDSNNNDVVTNYFTVTSAGTYTISVKAASVNSDFVVTDTVTASATVKYDTLGVTNPTPAVAWKDAGVTARVTFTPNKLSNGAYAPVSYYKVYRAVAGTADWKAVSGTVTDTLSSTSYVVDDTVPDNTVDYNYIVVVTDGTSFGNAGSSKTLSAYTGSTISYSSTTNYVTGAASIADKDNAPNDITWTITTDNSAVTVKAYGPIVHEVEASATDTAPAASDFDTTTALSFADSNNSNNGKTYTVYTKDVTTGYGNAYLLVVFTRDEYEDKYVVSEKVAVHTETIGTPTLSVETYDSSSTLASTTAQVLDDVIINVTDTINTTNNSISNYTYTLYRAKASLVTDTSSVTFSINSDAEWEKVEDVTMNSNEAYNSAKTSVAYVGVVKQPNLDDGLYAYQVVKTNKAGKKATAKDATTSAAVSYVTIDTSTSISYTPTISASFASYTIDSTIVTVKFTKNTQTLTAVDGTFADDATSTTYITGYTDEETPEEEVTYTVYRATLDASKTAVVYKKLGTVGTTTNNTVDKTIYTWDSTASAAVSSTKSYVNSITYTYTDTILSTSNSYSYIVVASKPNAEDKISDAKTVTGAN